jgi:hypothetical protein
VYLATIAAMTPWCAWLWQQPVLGQMQFPWRALSITMVLQALVFAGAGGAFARLRRPALQLLAACALLAAIGVWQRDQFRVGPKIRDAEQALRAELSAAHHDLQHYSADEFRPRTARVRPKPLGDAPVMTADHGLLSFAPESNPSRIVADLQTSQGTWVRLQQLYLPGWQVTINGVRVPDEELQRDVRSDGTMRFRALLPPGAEQGGHFRIEAGYAGPRGARTGNALAALALLTLAGWSWSERRARAAASPQNSPPISRRQGVEETPPELVT